MRCVELIFGNRLGQPRTLDPGATQQSRAQFRLLLGRAKRLDPTYRLSLIALALSITWLGVCSPTLAADTVALVPAYDHIVVVVMENRDYKDIIGNKTEAPYVNELAAKGALLTNYIAVAHPSLPNYYALYAGRTFSVFDDEDYILHAPTLATVLQKTGKTFAGYVEHPNATDSHQPWVSFQEGDDVERDFNTFPVGKFDSLPTVSFVIPNVDNDMHDGTIAQGDAWLKTNIDPYAKWAKNNNSLLILLWDETDDGDVNHVPVIFYGAHVRPGKNATLTNNYNILSTILAAYKQVAPGHAASAAVIDVFGRRGAPFKRPKLPPERGPLTPHVVSLD